MKFLNSLFTMIILFCGSIPGQAISNDGKRVRDFVISFEVMKDNMQRIPDQLAMFKNESKQIIKLTTLIRQLEKKNSFGLQMAGSLQELSQSYKRLIALREKMAVSIIDSYRLSHNKDLAKQFGWTDAQIAEIKEFKKITDKVYEDMAGLSHPTDEEVEMLLIRMQKHLQSRLVFYTRAFI